MRARFCLLAAAIAAGGLLLGGVFSSPARAELLIEIDKTTQRMVVTRNGEQLYVWPVSTGRIGRDTPSGVYTPFRMEIDHYSEEWDNAPMPHSVFFTKRGHAIHGSYEVKKLGTAASAGCVRLEPKNAERLFNLVREEGLNKVRVAIGGQVQPGRAPNDLIARGAPQTLDPQQYQDEQGGQRYIYRDRDSRYPDPYAGQRYDPRYAQPRSYYYDDFGRPVYVQPYRPPQMYYQRRGFGYGWD